MDKCYAGNVGGLGRNRWQTCVECAGRIHDVNCTSRINPAKDCCPQRHIKMGLSPASAQVRGESAQQITALDASPQGASRQRLSGSRQ